MKPDPTIRNAKITNVFLGREDHGLFTFWISVDYGGMCQNIGGYSLDEWDGDLNRRVALPKGLDIISEILNVVGVNSWEELPGQYIRVACHGLGSMSTIFGHILENKWIDIHSFFKSQEENNADD